MEVRNPFSKDVGKRKTKMKVLNPFSKVEGKRKMKMEVRIPFSKVVGKRLALRYTHSFDSGQIEDENNASKLTQHR